jgi:hypothetical protein
MRGFRAPACGYRGRVRSRRGRICVSSLALPLALAAGACGSSSSGGGSGAAKVRSAIDSALTTSDPAVCTAAYTRRYVEQTQLTKGRDAVPTCRRALREGRPAKRTTISRVRVSGDRARARVAIEGGDEDGATYDLRLVRDARAWKLDRITGVELDLERYLRAGERQLTRPPDAMPAKDAGCVVARLRRSGESRLERAIIAADASIVRDTVVSCLDPSTLRRQFEDGIRSALGQDADPGCVLARLHRSVSTRDLRAAVAASLDGGAPPPRITRAVARALIACGGGAPGAGGAAQNS